MPLPICDCKSIKAFCMMEHYFKVDNNNNIFSNLVLMSSKGKMGKNTYIMHYFIINIDMHVNDLSKQKIPNVPELK